MAHHRTILIAGPTASGKSNLAISLAKKLNGIIVNTDSMQVYHDLRLITARPSLQDELEAPHCLYGHIDAAEAYSTGAWLRSIEELLPKWQTHYHATIFTGGTGLYFKALTSGLSEIPEIPAELRQNLRNQLAQKGPMALHAQLHQEDPLTSAGLSVTDGQRIVRALEVLRHSGRPLRDWQNQNSLPLLDLGASTTHAMVLTPDRAVLAEKIAKRFRMMVAAGGIEEVQELLLRNLDPQLPAMKAIGVAEIGSLLNNEIDFDTAIERCVIATRQYAKRQSTWFRGQMGDKWQRFETPELALADFQ